MTGFPGGSVVKNQPANAGDMGLIPELGRSLEKEMKPIPVFLPGKSHGQRSLAGYRPWGHKRFRHDLVTTQQHNTTLGQANTTEENYGSILIHTHKAEQRS